MSVALAPCWEEGASALYIGSIHILCIWECLSSLHVGRLLLYEDESVSLFNREDASSSAMSRRVSVFHIYGACSFSMRRRVLPLCTSEVYSSMMRRMSHRVHLLYRMHTLYIWMKTKVSLVSIAGAESLSMEGRVCLSSPCRHSPTSLCGGYTLLLYRAAVSYLQARCHRRSLVCFSWICAVPCSCDIQLDLMATSPVFHCPVAHFSRLRTSVLTCCEFPCVLLSTLVSYISACLRRVHNLFGFGVCFGNAKCVADHPMACWSPPTEGMNEWPKEGTNEEMNIEAWLEHNRDICRQLGPTPQNTFLSEFWCLGERCGEGLDGPQVPSGFLLESPWEIYCQFPELFKNLVYFFMEVHWNLIER